LAATYSLPADLGVAGKPFANCSASTYICSGSVALGVGDVVNLTGNVSLSVTGSLSLGNNATINASGAYSLTLTVGGSVTTGTNAVIKANISATGPVGLGNNVVVTGNVTGSSISFGNINTSVVGACTPSYSQCSGLKLGKAASAGSALLNDVVTFTITATNGNATSWNSVVVTDVLPASMTYSAAAPTLGSVAVSGQTVTWSIPSIPANGSAQLTLAVTLVTQGAQTNTVTAPNASPASASVLVSTYPVTHYKFDQTVGGWTGVANEVLDSGTTGLHGKRVLSGAASTTTNVISPSPTIASQNAAVVGGFCNAANFDGNAVVQMPSNSAFQYTKTFSASTWIYPTSYPSGGSDLYSVLSNDLNYEFHLNPSGKLYWYWLGSTLTSLTSSTHCFKCPPDF